MPNDFECKTKISQGSYDNQKNIYKENVFNFANALSKDSVSLLPHPGEQMLQALSKQQEGSGGSARGIIHLAPHGKSGDRQTCSLLAEQESCFLSLLGLFCPWLPTSRFESEMKQMLRQGKKCFASLHHGEDAPVR